MLRKSSLIYNSPFWVHATRIWKFSENDLFEEFFLLFPNALTNLFVKNRVQSRRKQSSFSRLCKVTEIDRKLGL